MMVFLFISPFFASIYSLFFAVVPVDMSKVLHSEKKSIRQVQKKTDEKF